jgi:hypothetical protein
MFLEVTVPNLSQINYLFLTLVRLVSLRETTNSYKVTHVWSLGPTPPYSEPPPTNPSLRLTERTDHTCTAVGKKLYIFGGKNAAFFLNDMLIYDTGSEIASSATILTSHRN